MIESSESTARILHRINTNANKKALLRKLKSKQIEKYTVIMDWKTQYYEESDSPLTELEIQNNPYQNPSRLLFFFFPLW